MGQESFIDAVSQWGDRLGDGKSRFHHEMSSLAGLSRESFSSGSPKHAVFLNMCVEKRIGGDHNIFSAYKTFLSLLYLPLFLSPPVAFAFGFIYLYLGRLL